MSGGNICFSKDGTFYGASDMFLITEGGSVFWLMKICSFVKEIHQMMTVN